MILPLFDVGDIFYDSANVSYLNKLQVLQNRATRVLLNLPSRQNTDEAHIKLNLLKLRDRIKLHLIQLAHWMTSKKEFLNSRRLNTRAHVEGRKIITQDTPRRELYCNSFRYKTAKYWNSLPTSIHVLKHSDKDKKTLKKLALEQIISDHDVA